MWDTMRLVVYCLVLVMGLPAHAETRKERDSRAVRISQGPVRGFKADDGDYFVYYNIPYATAPTGMDRFKAPHPCPVWLTERKAVDENIVCPQAQFLVAGKTMQENCLIANVYVPDTNQTNIPVVVYVHGGAYQIGYGDEADPSPLVRTKKVIAVTFNYRLGIHGFLCLGTNDAPGNAGMKDVVALLHWVKKNIAVFGGNPNEVTIDGYSAGASAVGLLAMSESSKGLFNKLIVQSGAEIAPWSVQIDPVENARSYAEEKLGFKGGDKFALEKLYKELPYEDLTKDTFLDKQSLGFVPCVERDTGVERFLEKAPYEIFKEGTYNKLPTLIGFTNMEGLVRFNNFEIWKHQMNQNFSSVLPVDLEFKDEIEKEKVAKEVKEFYFGNRQIDNNTLPDYVNYFTDIIIAFPTLWSTELQVKSGHTQIFSYLFSYAEEAVSRATGITDPRLVRGATHCAQTNMVLENHLLSLPANIFSKEYKKVRSEMIDIWTNFISTGSPVPAGSSLPGWPAVGKDGLPNMSIDNTLELQGRLLEERKKFWLNIYEKHYRIPTAPQN